MICAFMTYIGYGIYEQNSIPVGCVPSTCQSYNFRLPPLDVRMGEIVRISPVRPLDVSNRMVWGG